MGNDRGREASSALTWGQLLRQYRARARLTQEMLAEQSGYSPDYISKLERDQRKPPFVAVDRLADVLDLDEHDRQALREAREQRGPEPRAGRRPSLAPLPLPAPTTPLIGRVAERAAVHAALRESRLVTLTGVAGTGKTRLAVQVAADAAGDARFADGVAFVNLAPVRDAHLLALSVAQALGLPDQPGAPENHLTIALRHLDLLLVIDNMEHLLEEAPLLGRLLVAAPRLSILATSRVSLHLYGEHEIRVPPLPLPAVTAGSDGTPFPAKSLASDAVQLFIARARAHAPGFAPEGETLESVARICTALDGLPLAIELAAARVNLFPPEAILPRLRERLALLTGGPRDLPDRQRTLRGALDWSYTLLTPSEQALFGRLGVFAGSFDAKAVAAVCAEDSAVVLTESEAEIGEDALLTRLALLVEQSLVEVTPGPTPRFRLLETLREYALTRLAATGATERAQSLHLQYYVSLAEKMRARLLGPQQGAALQRLEEEHDNLRAALRWALANRENELGLRLARALGRFWRSRGHLREGQYWLEAAQANVTGTTERGLQVLRTDVLREAGSLAMIRGDYAQATSFHVEALSLRRAMNDTLGIAQSLTSLGNVASRQGDYSRSAAMHAEALEAWRAQDHVHGVSVALGNLGRVALQQGDESRAQTLLEETLALKHQLGDTHGIAGTLTSLGRLAAHRGDYARATALLEESLELKKSLGDRHGQVTALAQLGWVAFLRGDLTWAQAVLGEGLQLGQEIGARDRVAEIVESLAVIAAADGRPHDAARLGGAAEALRIEMGVALAPDRNASHVQLEQRLRTVLGDDALPTAWAAGKTLRPEDVIALALEEVAT